MPDIHDYEKSSREQPHRDGGDFPEIPKKIEQYRIQRPLGQGNFGRVFQALDEELKGQVAIKILLPRRAGNAEERARFLNEAQIAAQLRHPNIVRALGCGEFETRNANGQKIKLCYVVYDYVEGVSLDRWLIDHPKPVQAARIVLDLCLALDYVHRKEGPKEKVIHRDIKPSNILMERRDAEGDKPWITDFGIAVTLHELGSDDFKTGGTKLYQSPEQANDNAHRVSPSSDVYSLGVILYEMLVGPERAAEILTKNRNRHRNDQWPLEPSVPERLRRICHRALQYDEGDRYPYARDMARDLKEYLDSLSATETPVEFRRLGAYTAEDAEFFLQLLPGERGAYDLPESIRFWKTRFESTEEQQKDMKLCVLYGQSGCGKTSLVQAGLLPCLAPHVLPIYLQASPDRTEAKLLQTLQQTCPELRGDLNLTQAICSLRDDDVLPKPTQERPEQRRKILIVLDQFEQWLHGRTRLEDTELVRAMRECDNCRVQTLVMVRHEYFSLGIEDFFTACGVQLIQGTSSSIDGNWRVLRLLSKADAKAILTKFGRVLGKLKDFRDADRLDRHTEFLNQVVEELAEDDGILCVRLALFVEIMLYKPWTLESLAELGGARGIGVRFLQETFHSSSSPAHWRNHASAAKRVLRVLLRTPDRDHLAESCQDHRAVKRSRQELYEAYSLPHGSLFTRLASTVRGILKKKRASTNGAENADHAVEFQALMRILETELQLITPVEIGPDDHHSSRDAKYYQLTHDYLIPSIREWLLRDLKKSRAGRAQLLLMDHASLWSETRSNKYLPSPLECLRIRFLYPRGRWTNLERRMMRRARRMHRRRFFLGTLLLSAIGFVGIQQIRAQYLVRQLSSADNAASVLTAVSEMDWLIRFWVNPILRGELASSKDEAYKLQAREERILLNLRLALLPTDAEQLEDMGQDLLDLPTHEFNALLPLLKLQKDAFVSFLEDSLANAIQPSHSTEETKEDIQRRVNAAVALMHLGQPDSVWPLLRHSSDPSVRTWLIHQFSNSGVDPALVLEQLRVEQDGSTQRALIQMLGEYSFDPGGLGDEATEYLIDLYKTNSDAGIHSSCEWVLRQWKKETEIQASDRNVRTSKAFEERNWYRNGRGHRMVRIERPKNGGIIRVGSSPDDMYRLPWEPNEALGNLEHTFAICDTETTVTQFRAFINDCVKTYQFDHMESIARASFNGEHEHGADRAAMNFISWNDAAAYCNWLSKVEGIPESEWCYEIDPNEPRKLRAKSDALDLQGYRLPTDAEWEYACRAGADTLFCFGNSISLLNRYACCGAEYANYSAWAVRSGKPNDFGIFDMHGNLYEWCHDQLGGNGLTDNRSSGHVIRGGSFAGNWLFVRSAYRDVYQPVFPLILFGFRVARTVP